MVFNIYLNSPTVFNIYFNSPTDIFEFFVNISHERKYEVIGYFFKFRLIVEFLVVYNGPVIITFHLSCTCIQNYNLFKYLNPHLVLSIFLKNSVMIKTKDIRMAFNYEKNKISYCRLNRGSHKPYVEIIQDYWFKMNH